MHTKKSDAWQMEAFPLEHVSQRRKAPQKYVLDSSRGYLLTASRHEQPVSFFEWLEGLENQKAAREALLHAWSEIPFNAFVWELPALTQALLHRPFECVVIHEPALTRPAPSAQAFREHLAGANVVEVSNLGGDARLIIPAPRGDNASYGHLASFARSGPRDQAHDLLQCLGSVALREIGNESRWLSTSGLGVPWLHFRCDTRPKYYQHAPYRDQDYLINT